MTVLVTGAGGYLGRHVVLALHRRGHGVRALDLPRMEARGEGGAPPGVEEVRADLCASPDLAKACEGAQAVVHLAARMQGDEESIVRTAVEGTGRLLEAMERAGVRRMVLASSLSVYDWGAIGRALDESSPLEPRPVRRDAYTIAKVRQEQLARSRCQESGIALTMLRPGVIWGRGREYPPTIGQRAGPIHLLVGAARQLPSVHVENCADAFAAAVDAGDRADGAFNVVDHPDITVRRFVEDHLRRSDRFGLLVPVPYGLALAAASLLDRLAPAAVRSRLPSFLAPARFAARYKPVLVEAARLRGAIGWLPPLSYGECLDRTYGGPAAG